MLILNIQVSQSRVQQVIQSGFPVGETVCSNPCALICFHKDIRINSEDVWSHLLADMRSTSSDLIVPDRVRDLTHITAFKEETESLTEKL